MPNVALIDYGMGNLDSMRRALEECGARVFVARSGSDLRGMTHMVLPGVGSFSAASRHLSHRDLREVIRHYALDKEVPLLGVCLGMQLFATDGTEGGLSPGLDLIPGHVVALESEMPSERIPHVGWNEVVTGPGKKLFEGIPDETDFYFVHSFHFVTDNAEDSIGRTSYCGGFTSVVGRTTLWGTQFHPEKSQRAGFQVLKNFLKI